jgi:hypothetical protein
LTVIFLHIPKAAGTTLHRILERQYPSDAIFSIGPDAHASIREFKELPEPQRAAIRLFRGHMPFGLHTYLPAQSSYFTLLRDPVERVLSYYHFIQRTPDHYLYHLVGEQKMSLKDLLTTGEPIMMNDAQVRLISGVWADVGYGEVTEAVLAAASHNLRHAFTIVGLAEQFDATLLLLQRTYQWGNVFYRRENVGHNRLAQAQYDPETLALVRHYNQRDMALYAEAQALFTQQLHQQGITFSARLAWFRLLNRFYQRGR